MSGDCDYCCHVTCVNGESGMALQGECEMCGTYMQLCSTQKDRKQQTRNGHSCGCGDKTDEWICNKCRNKADLWI